MVEERRQCERTQYSGRAYLTYSGRCRADEVVELSKGGLKLRSAAPIRAGKSVKLFLPLPGRLGWQLCMLNGRVVRRDRIAKGQDQLAIQLIPSEGDNSATLEKFLSEKAA